MNVGPDWIKVPGGELQQEPGQVAILDNMVEQLYEQRVGVSLRLKAQENQLDLTQQELADLEELFETLIAYDQKALLEELAAEV